jgi:YD repeat-containing protein
MTRARQKTPYLTLPYLTLPWILLMAGLGVSSAQPVNNLLGDVGMATPEAASLGKYVDIPVGLYTGVPNISIPIHTARDGAVSLPVSLSYHASGIKVGEPAGQAGLGWALNAGGRVMRTVLGLPDEHDNGYFTNAATVQAIPAMDPSSPPSPAQNSAILAIHEGQADGEADIFSYNFAGYSGKFYFDAQQKPVLVPKQNITIITHLISSSQESGRLRGFTFITPDGAKYHFGVTGSASSQPAIAEKTGFLGDNLAATSWMLVKVESPDGKHKIDLEYETERYSYKSLGTCTSAQLEASPISCSRVLDYSVSGYRLSSIVYGLGRIDFIAGASGREDLHPYNFGGSEQAKPLAKIVVQEGLTTLCKEFELSHGYWAGIPQSSPAGAAPEGKRLKLLSVREESCGGGIALPPYTFSYIGDGGPLPSRLSMAIDHWGYYNGADGNNSVFNSNVLNIPPISEQIPTSNGLTTISYPGTSDREAHEGPMLLGTLEQIGYPTGGSHRFEYEANDYYRVRLVPVPPILNMKIGYGESATCNTTMSTVGAPNPVKFNSADMPSLTYALHADLLNCNPPIPDTWVTIKVFLAGTVTLVAERQFYVGSAGLNVSGSLLSLFVDSNGAPLLQPETNYRFESTTTNSWGEFDILSDKTEAVAENAKAGGLRVKKTIIDPGAGGAPIVRRYEYRREDGAQSSGVLYNPPRYWFNYDQIPIITGPGTIGSGCYNCTLSSENSLVPLGDYQGNHIGYERAKEILEGNGWSIYTFYTEQPPAGASNYGYAQYPFPPEQLREVAGNESGGSVWDEGGEELQRRAITALPDGYEPGASKMAKTAGTNPSGGGVLWQTYQVRTRRPYRVEAEEQYLDGVSAVTTYEYEGRHHLMHPHYNPTAVTIVNSDGAAHRTEYEYALEQGKSDFLDPATNMAGIPLQEKKFAPGPAGGWRKGYTGLYPTHYYEILPDGSELLRGSISGYNSDGLPLDYTAMGFAPIEYVWTSGKLLQRKSFLSWQWGYDYHDQGQSPFPAAITDIDGQAVSYKYDQLGRLIAVSSRGGAVETSYGYQIGGGDNRVTAVTSYSDGTPTQYVEESFDGLGRLTKRLHNGVPKLEQYYDGAGRIEREAYQVGTYTTYEYEPSPLGRAVRAVFPDGAAVEAQYGGENNYYKVVSIDEKGNASASLTDVLGRQYRLVDALGGITGYSYDGRGNLASVSPPAGSSYEYTYDLRNRLGSKKVPGRAPQLFRYYDSDDLLRYSIDGNGNRLDYEYDEYKREKLVRHAKINGWNPANPSGPHGSPGSLIIENAYGEGSPQPINIGKLLWTRARLLDGSPANFVRSDFEYDPFGRVRKRFEQGAPTGGAGRDEYTFDYNDADWLEREIRAHKGLEEFSLTTRHIYDRSGREIGYTAFAGQMPDGFLIGRSYDIKDQVKAKYYGSLAPFNALDRAKYRYNVRGWLTHLNDIYYGVQKYDICGEGSDVGGDTIQIEKDVDFPELIEELCVNAGNVEIEGLGPCDGGACYIEAFSYTASYTVPAYAGIHGPLPQYRLSGLYAGGQLVPLSYPFFYNLPSSRSLFVQELGAWLSQNSYAFESIEFEADPPLDGSKRQHYRVLIRISGTNAPFEHVIEQHVEGLGSRQHAFTPSGPDYIPCPELPGNPKGGEHEQPQSLQQALAMMAAKTPASLSYPAALYRARFNDSTTLWMFEDELAVVRGSYRREQIANLSGPAQPLRARYLDGTQQSLSMSALLSERAGPDRDKLDKIEPEQAPPGCSLPELSCTPQQQRQQAASVAQIQNAMCNMYPDNYTLPLTMYLVQLCDGSTMYILGDDLLGQLEGPHLVLVPHERSS